MKSKKRIIVFSTALILIAVTWLLAGCGKEAVKPPGQGTDKPPAATTPAEKKETVVLYFSDSQAQYLMPEQREITRQGEALEEAVLKELIKGPAAAGLVRTIPPEASLLSVAVANGVAEVNFSREFQTRHWGGSSGETMTLYSVVNTLAKLPGITSVQFMVEGKKMDTLAGHFGTASPLKPDWDLVKEGK